MRASLIAFTAVALLGLLVAAPALVASGAFGQVLGSQPFAAFRYDPPVPAPKFTLISHDGRRVSLDDLRGQYLLTYFGYTYCPDICPSTLITLAKARSSLGAKAAHVQILFITVDPERDTPEVIGRYVRRFDPEIIGLTGDPGAIAQTARAYGVTFSKVPLGNTGNYSVDHSAYIFLVDPQGRLVFRFDYREGWEDLARILRATVNGD